MKKLKYLLLFLLLVPFNVSAATINCSAPSSVSVGETFTVTFSGTLSSPASVWFAKIGSSDNLTYSGGSLSIDGVDGASMSNSVSFKATSVGQASIYAYDVDVSDGTNTYTDSDTCYVNIVQPTSSSSASTSSNNSSKSNDTQNEKNSDNSLKSLSIEGVKLNPDFDKDTLEYNIKLSNDTKKIKINAEATVSTSTISGIGEIDVNEGSNKIQIVVTAENASSRTYVINAYVQEQDEITVKINNNKYIVLKKITGIETPDGFEKKNIKINNKEVEGFYNDKLGYSLVALKDSIGNITLYIYDKKTDAYTKYSPIVSETLYIIVLPANEDDIPHAYHKSTFLYNNEVVYGYALSEKSDFRLIYGINVENGEKGYFLYDMNQKTLQRFYNDQVNIYVELVRKCKLAFLILGSFIIVLTIIIIILLSKNVKFKNKYLSKRLDAIDNPIKYQDLEGTKTMSHIDIPDEKKNKKRKKREKTFLDE